MFVAFNLLAIGQFFIFARMSEGTPGLSNRLQQIAKSPIYRGAIFQIEADDKGLALVDCKEASLKVYLMFDPDTDQVLETRFFTYGGPIFTALADIFCTKIQMKTISQVAEIKVEDLELALRDTPDVRAIPETAPELAQMQKLIGNVVSLYPAKRMVALAARETMEKIRYRTQTAEGRAEADNEWLSLSKEEQLRRIEDCLHEKIRGFLHSEGGDLEILELVEGRHLRIRYQGACAGCGSALSGTLYYIEDQLRENVYYNLSVEPDDSALPV